MGTTPPSWTSKEARWQARQTARAQRMQWKAQARAQRDYYRSYWRGWHRPSFVGPIILLTIGVIALLMETGKLDPGEFWGWYAHWWPMLLIVMGGLLLAEHFMDWNRPWGGRRSMGGIVWLVIFMICLGWISREGHLMGPFSWEFSGDDGDNFWSWMGPEHDNDVQIDQVLTAAKPVVTVNDPQGDVTITASSDNQMHLRAHQMVHRNSDTEAQKIFEKLKPNVDLSAGGAVITVPEQSGARVDVALQLPAAAYATVSAGHGDVTVDGLNGGVQVTDIHGEVKLEDIGGDAQGHINHGDFAAHNVQGRVLVDGRGDDVTLSQIQGAVTIDGDFFGDIHLEQIGGQVHFHSSQTSQLEIAHLQGTLTLDKSDLSLSQAAGPVRIVARSKDIDLTQIAGDAHIEDSNGDVNVVMANPLGNVQITDHTGNVIVTMPENANFTVTGSTSGDEAVRTDFPLKMATNDGRQTLEGSVGHGGVQLQLETDHGNLELRKGENTTLALTPPKPPAPPEPPAAAKHFKEQPGAKVQEQ